MGREEYMRQLAYLLQDITDSEREEALQYYHDYFDDAGVSEEANVIATLGSPEKVAAMIKDGLSGADRSAGEYTESGYQDVRFREDNKVPGPRRGSQRQREEKRQDSQWSQGQQDGQNRESYQSYQGYQENPGQDGGGFAKTWGQDERSSQSGRRGRVLLIVLLCIFAIPVIFPIIGTGFGLIFGAFGVLFGIAAAVVTGTFACLVAGVAMIGVGIAQMFVSPPTGFLLTGLGLIGLAIGLLLMLAAFWVIKKAIPALIRGVTSFCGRIFRRRRRS